MVCEVLHSKTFGLLPKSGVWCIVRGSVRLYLKISRELSWTERSFSAFFVPQSAFYSFSFTHYKSQAVGAQLFHNKSKKKENSHISSGQTLYP